MLFVRQVPHLQIMGLEEKEQMFTMGDQDLDMVEDINIGGLQIIRFEFFLFCRPTMFSGVEPVYMLTLHISPLIMHMKKLLDSDWLRAVRSSVTHQCKKCNASENYTS